MNYPTLVGWQGVEAETVPGILKSLGVVELALLASIPVGLATYFIERWLYRTGRTQSRYLWAIIVLIFLFGGLAYLLTQDIAASSAVASIGWAGFWLAQAYSTAKRAERAHPTAKEGQS